MRPPVVCLCGSTRFAATFREANLRETLAGKIVLSIGCEWHSDQALGLTEADKARLDALHLAKIDLADTILVLNVGGYIGDSTRREIAYAQARGKPIRYWEKEGNAMHNQHDYLWIRAWGKMMGSFASYIEREVDQARRENAPFNATYKRHDGRWSTTDDITNPATLRYLGLDRREHDQS